MSVSMVVRGGEQLTRNLRRLAGNERRQAQHDGLEAGARVVEAYAKIAAPVDTGNLQGSIQVQEVTPIQAIIGPSNIDYAEFVEFGTSRMAAQPYMRPAIDEHEREIVDAVQRTVAAFVESIRA